MLIRRYRPDEFFRACIDTMDDFDYYKTYVAEFCFGTARHGEAVFTHVEDAERFLSRIYAESAPEAPAVERQYGWPGGY